MLFVNILHLLEFDFERVIGSLQVSFIFILGVGELYWVWVNPFHGLHSLVDMFIILGRTLDSIDYGILDILEVARNEFFTGFITGA